MVGVRVKAGGEGRGDQGTGSRASPTPDPVRVLAGSGKRDGGGSRPWLLTLLLGAPAPLPESRVTVDVERSIPQRQPAAGPQQRCPQPNKRAEPALRGGGAGWDRGGGAGR